MNTSEFEKRMQSLLEQQEEYVPDDAAWSKMQQALHPASAPKILFLLPAWKTAAAAAIVLVMAVAGRYLFIGEGQHTQPLRVAAQQKAKKQSPAADKILARVPQTAKEPVTQSRQEPILTGTRHPQTMTADTLAQPVIAAQQQPASPPPVAATHKGNSAIPTEKKHSVFPDPYKTNNDFTYLQPKHGFNLGIAGNIGKPSLGRVQYNIGVVARQQISERIFAEANVSLAATQVNYSEQANIPSNVGSVDLGETNGPYKSFNINYASNIIAIGFAPSIGINATSNISISVGGDLYKSLNRTLLRERNAAMSGAEMAMVDAGKNVTDWDAGIKAQLEYKLGKKFSVNTQYRQGLTQYILIDGQSFKNSIFNIGLKYYINHR